MATKLDTEFVKAIRKNHQDAVKAQQDSRLGFETLVNEVNRLEAYCEELLGECDAWKERYDTLAKQESKLGEERLERAYAAERERDALGKALEEIADSGCPRCGGYALRNLEKKS